MKELPNNFIAEQSILNILLTNPSFLPNTLLALQENAFYHEPHKLIYQILIELSEKGDPINLTSILTKLKDKNLLQKIGGPKKLISIINYFDPFSNLENSIDSVNEQYFRRLVIELGKNLINWSSENTLSFEDILSNLNNSLFKLNQKKELKKIYTATEIIDTIFEEIRSKETKKHKFGYESSFKDLDAILQGFQPSDLIIISGRPSMGKTAFSLNLAKNIVENYQIPLIIFSLEMSREQIMYRFISSDAKINNNRLKSKKMTSDEWKELSKSMKKIAELPIYVNDNPNLTINDIRAQIQKIFLNNNETGLIIIDYLQLMKVPFKLENRVQEVSYLTRSLKILAKEFNIPIILLSQLSRNVESRINKRPMLSDLRESGCLGNSNQLLKTYASWNSEKIISYPNSIPFHIKGLKPTFLIFFQNGFQFQITANHKILSRQGWIKISQISTKTEICYFIKDPQSLKLTSENFFYQKVCHIAYQGIQFVYDKVIPVYHNYLLKNILFHNSIEQDADIVIMIYREDYYNENKLDTQITEFIVAKHRNGPLGTAKLIFSPSYTQFQNLK
uniref:Replicative DNA helicase n=1 Tax=Synura sphagnicola TaxID=52556 RepID=A0A3G2QYN2_9STRA|nr:replicative DNA helicase [Synura sphagnicola]